MINKEIKLEFDKLKAAIKRVTTHVDRIEKFIKDSKLT